MKITYIHHSCFLTETDRFYYLFDYEQGDLPALNPAKPMFFLSSHGHFDHFNPDIIPELKNAGMENILAVLSDDIDESVEAETLLVAPGREYDLGHQCKLTTFQSTDLGVAFLIEDQGTLLYHSGDLNDWVWEEESDEYNAEMTAKYQAQIQILAEKLDGRTIDVAFAVLDPRQGKDYDRGLCYLLENVAAKQVYPMHYWDKPDIIDTFLNDHPEYQAQIQKAE